MSMTRDEYAESIARRPRQMTREQEFLLTARQFTSDLTRHRRAHARALTLLRHVLDSVEQGWDGRAEQGVKRAIEALARAEAPTTAH